MWAAGKTANAFGGYHAVGTIWKFSEFFTSAGPPVANGHIIAGLLQAIHLPSKVTMVHLFIVPKLRKPMLYL